MVLGEDRDDYGTEFGPTNTALHAVAVAVELGDAGPALDLADSTRPSTCRQSARPATASTWPQPTLCAARSDNRSVTFK